MCFFSLDKSNIASFIQEVLRSLFISIDTIVYRTFAFLYQLFVQVAKLDLHKDLDIINYLFERVQILVGVVALFCLSISVIRYIIEPDTLNDKNKGAGAIIKRVLISVVLLISLNSIFEEARNIQNNIIFEGNTNVASRLLGNSSSTNEKLSPGARIAVDTFFSFFRDNSDHPTLNNNFSNNSNSSGGSSYLASNIKDAIENSYIDGKPSWLYVTNSVNLKQDNVYNYEYDYLISTLTGGILVYIMICYCLSVGVRVFKLVFLQLISPLPIIMNITDKGQETFKKWVKQCVSTYFDLVIKLFIIELVITFSSQILTTDFSFSGVDSNMLGWVKVVMVVSLLIFAKKAIDLIKDLFPGVGSDDLSLKKLVGSAFGKGTVGGVIGGFVGATAGLGAKKLISGIDSAKHGKGFMAGARKVQGKGALSKFNKWYDGLTPNRIEHRNKLDLANATIADRNKMYAEGEQLYNKFNGILSAEAFDNCEFRTSWQNVEDAKKTAKSAGTAQARAQAELEAAANRSYKDEEERASAIKKASDNVEKANGALKAAEGALSKRKELHEQMRLKYEKDARKEDSFDYYKKSTSQEERDAALNSAIRSSTTNNSTTARGPGFTGSVGNGVSPTTNNNNNSSIRDNNNSPRNFFGDDGGKTGE